MFVTGAGNSMIPVPVSYMCELLPDRDLLCCHKAVVFDPEDIQSCRNVADIEMHLLVPVA